MSIWLLTTYGWGIDALTVVAVDHYESLAKCKMMGRLASDWFGVEWTCTMSIWT